VFRGRVFGVGDYCCGCVDMGVMHHILASIGVQYLYVVVMECWSSWIRLSIW
jgi:hypothetical protein